MNRFFVFFLIFYSSILQSFTTINTNILGSSIIGNGNLTTNTLSHSNLANTSSYQTNSSSIGTNGGYFLNNADSSTSSALATISNGIDIASPISLSQASNTNHNQASNINSTNNVNYSSDTSSLQDKQSSIDSVPLQSIQTDINSTNHQQSLNTIQTTNNTLATSLLSLNRDVTKNNNITLKDYTQTAIDKQRDNTQIISLANTLKGKVNSLKQDIKDIANIDDSTSKGNNTYLSINAITEGIITGIVTQDFLSTATAIANPYIANSIKHITQDNTNLSPKAQLITNVLAHSAYGALAGGLSSQSIDSLSSITSSNTTLLNSMLSGGLSAGSAPLIARLASNALYDTDDASSLSVKQQEVIKSIVSLSGGIIGASVSNFTDSSNSLKYASIGANQAINEVENNSFAKALRTIGYPALKTSLQKGKILTPQELALITKNATQEISDELESIITNPLSLSALDSSIGLIAGIKPSEVADVFTNITNYVKSTNFSNNDNTISTNTKYTIATNDTNTQIPPISLDENTSKTFITTIPKSNHKQHQLTQIPSHTKTTQDVITTLPKHTKDTPIITTPSIQEIDSRVYLSEKKDDWKQEYDKLDKAMQDKVDEWEASNTNPLHNLQKHYEKHGKELGSTDVGHYARQTIAIRDKLKKDIRNGKKVEGFTDEVYRHRIGKYYIDLQADTKKIISFGLGKRQ